MFCFCKFCKNKTKISAAIFVNSAQTETKNNKFSKPTNSANFGNSGTNKNKSANLQKQNIPQILKILHFWVVAFRVFYVYAFLKRLSILWKHNMSAKQVLHIAQAHWSCICKRAILQIVRKQIYSTNLTSFAKHNSANWGKQRIQRSFRIPPSNDKNKLLQTLHNKNSANCQKQQILQILQILPNKTTSKSAKTNYSANFYKFCISVFLRFCGFTFLFFSGAQACCGKTTFPQKTFPQNNMARHHARCTFSMHTRSLPQKIAQ